MIAFSFICMSCGLAVCHAPPFECRMFNSNLLFFCRKFTTGSCASSGRSSRQADQQASTSSSCNNRGNGRCLQIRQPGPGRKCAKRRRSRLWRVYFVNINKIRYLNCIPHLWELKTGKAFWRIGFKHVYNCTDSLSDSLFPSKRTNVSCKTS